MNFARPRDGVDGVHGKHPVAGRRDEALDADAQPPRRDLGPPGEIIIITIIIIIMIVITIITIIN